MYIKDIEKTLELVDLCRNEIVPCFLGSPGIGKTQAIYDYAKKHNKRVVEIILSQCLPTEISGLTMPNNETKSMDVFDHARLSSLKDGDILFLDELLEAPPMVLSACLTLIQERRMMSGVKLPDIMIVAATNEPYDSITIKPSVKQRFMWLPLKFNSEDWMHYIRNKYGIKSSLISPMLNYFQVADASNNYNFVTPRTLEKLIVLTLKCYQEGFNSHTLEVFLDSLNIPNSLIKYLKDIGTNVSSYSIKLNQIKEITFNTINESKFDDEVLFITLTDLINRFKDNQISLDAFFTLLEKHYPEIYSNVTEKLNNISIEEVLS